MINGMNTEIRVPSVPNAGVNLSLGRWFKRTGDAVTRGEPLVELNTGNITHEISAPITGVLSEILFSDGSSVTSGAVLGTIRQF